MTQETPAVAGPNTRESAKIIDAAVTSYDIFGKFYDAVMGDRAEATDRLRRLDSQGELKSK